MMSNKKTYQVKWTNTALNQLSELVSESEAEKIKGIVKEILSQDPYDKLKYIERKVRPNRHIDIKRLDWDWNGSWRLKYKKFRIVYKILGEQITVRVFKFGERIDVYRDGKDAWDTE